MDEIMECIKLYAQDKVNEYAASKSKIKESCQLFCDSAEERLSRIKILIRRLEQDTKIECYKDAIKIVSGV